MKVVTVVGARPQFIKATPVSRAIRRDAREVLVHTGQHYNHDLSDVFFDQLALPKPDYNLAVGSGPHGAQTGAVLARLEEVIDRERPDWVLVYGDTNSTLAGSLAAAKLNVGVAHVEAGLRSYNRRMPEEVNRVLADHLSNLLFCPTDQAVANLAREGITAGVHQVGDVMYDSVLEFAALARERSGARQRFEIDDCGYVLLTIHRAENTDDPSRLEAILRTMAGICRPVLFPLHPRTKNRLEANGLAGLLREPVRILPPLSYLDMLALEQAAEVIVTDSGGVQKEAFILGIPCITCRDETEWVETLEAGANVLVGADPARLQGALEKPPRSVCAAGQYGDGHAAERVAYILYRGR